MLVKRTWTPCTDEDINYLYNGVWEYITQKYGYIDKPKLYLNKSNSIHQLGLFSWEGKDSAITLNQLFIKHKEGVLNTIVHEFAHYLVHKKYSRNQGHNYRWHLIADELGRHFGENITTYCSHNHEVLEEARELKPKVVRQRHHYELVCEHCGHVFTYKQARWWFKDKFYVDDANCTCPYCKNHNFEVRKK